ncbi:MAG: alkaline shock response membrane anchor protein AmaP [Hamadaea sp.]|nr:alkaline shock response membrane anchor protein AmaP [Hamadaea sp.]NUT02066.1 alkaline shock response membrane anchor protein AmaP [Hamadaea sp.]
MRKIVNRLLGIVVALALIAVSVVAIIEVVAAAVGARPVLVDWPSALDWARRTRWDDTALKATGLLLALAGIALLLFELWPSRVRRLPVDSPDANMDAAVTRRGLAQDMTAAAGEVDGVTPERVKVGRNRIRVLASARDSLPERVTLQEDVAASASRHLDRMRLSRRPRLNVTVAGRS